MQKCKGIVSIHGDLFLHLHAQSTSMRATVLSRIVNMADDNRHGARIVGFLFSARTRGHLHLELSIRWRTGYMNSSGSVPTPHQNVGVLSIKNIQHFRHVNLNTCSRT